MNETANEEFARRARPKFFIGLIRVPITSGTASQITFPLLRISKFY
jgi:hypothetical protein